MAIVSSTSRLPLLTSIAITFSVIIMVYILVHASVKCSSSVLWSCQELYAYGVVKELLPISISAYMFYVEMVLPFKQGPPHLYNLSESATQNFVLT